MLTIVHVDAAPVVDAFVCHLNHLGGLRDLEWERDVGDARHAGLEALRDGVFGAIPVVLLPFG